MKRSLSQKTFFLVGCWLTFLQPIHAVKQEVYHADYVVVGMGAAGAGVAKLLSDNHDVSVIGIEAGKNQDDDAPITDSTKAFDLEPSYYATYFFQQEQQPEAFNGEQYHYTTGFLWGGGSSINGEQYVQGTNKNYQRWEDLLGSRWSVKKIREAFHDLEDYNGRTNNPKARGTQGAVDIRQAPKKSTTMARKFVDAIAASTNFPEILDYNDPETPIGPFTRWQLYQQPNGSRESSSTAYLDGIVSKGGQPFGKRNLIILSRSSVNRVLFDKNQKAIGVQFEKEGKIGKVFAKKKVILCTGIFSPKLLLLSGIGPRELLKSKGIPLVYHNPNVGENLVNHPIISAVFTANPDDVGVPDDDLNALYVGGAFLPNAKLDSDPSQRDIQLIGISFEPGTFIVSALLINPKSRGHVKIQSNDCLKPLLATDAILDNADDLESFKDIFRVYIANLATKLGAIDPQYQLIVPTLDVINDDDLLTDYIKDNVDVAHHWMGSCRMAPKNEGGVVDEFGHVYGVKDLVIADDSIAPFPNDGNTSAPAFMIGRMIALQLIQSDLPAKR